MALLYLDEGLSVQTDRRLVDLGDDVIDARSVVRDGTSDHQHLLIATRFRRILVTHNRVDFELLHHAWVDWFQELANEPRPVHAGIVIIPQPPLVSADTGADLIHALVMTKQRRHSPTGCSFGKFLRDGKRSTHNHLIRPGPILHVGSCRTVPAELFALNQRLRDLRR